MDRLRAMQVFMEVVDRGSFAAAADAIGISRNMASRHVSDLERHLGARLLNRTTRSLSLTSTGAAYLESAREILTALEDADRDAGLQTQTASGRLSLSAPMSFGTRHIAPYLPQFTAANPDVKVDMHLNDRQVDLVEEGFDVAIRITRQMADSTLVARRIASTSLILCASPDYLWRYPPPPGPAGLAHHRCVGYSLGNEGNVWPLIAADGQRETVRVEPRVLANNGDAIQAMVLAGEGIAVQPGFIANPDIEAGRLVRVLPGWSGGEIGVYAISIDKRYEPLKVRSFVDWIANLYRPQPPWLESS